MSARGVGHAIAAMALGAGLGLALGSETARASEPGSETPEGQRTELQQATQPSPYVQQLLEERERRYQRQTEWWTYTRATLLDGIALSPEQSREVDALIETQLSKRARLQDVDTELKIAQHEGAEQKRIKGLRAKRRALEAKLMKRHEVMEAMRALLTEEQRPTFDMNRAHLVSERKPPRPRRARKTSPSPPRSPSS
jgi:hypothetical protein